MNNVFTLYLEYFISVDLMCYASEGYT